MCRTAGKICKKFMIRDRSGRLSMETLSPILKEKKLHFQFTDGEVTQGHLCRD